MLFAALTVFANVSLIGSRKPTVACIPENVTAPAYIKPGMDMDQRTATDQMLFSASTVSNTLIVMRTLVPVNVMRSGQAADVLRTQESVTHDAKTDAQVLLMDTAQNA